MSIYAQANPVQLSDFFTWVDWGVVFGYLILTTWVGHAMRGKQATIRDFFLGGRSLPWPAVSGSIIATAISGVTFIGVPGMVFALTGNFTYMQWALGAIIARIIVGIVFVKAFYEEEIYSPYDYMGRKLGIGAKRLATIIFSVGAILGQSVRVLVAALALDVVTPWDFEWCIVAIGVFAIAWTLMGGMQTVIWTDVMQFLLFIVGGLLALFWIVGGLDGGWGGFVDAGKAVTEANKTTEWGKFSLIDLTRHPGAGFTLWVAIIATPFLNLSAYGVDQLNAQRMFCCRSQSDAKKAIIWSSVGELITLLMLTVGAALFVWYQQRGLMPLEAGKFADHDYVFPTWITTTLPVGLRGLILAGIFAAAISSLDSILAALSQTTLSLFVDPEADSSAENSSKLLVWSRALVIAWGLLLSGFAILLNDLREGINIVNLAFGMVAYTAGPMLAIFIAALKFPQSGVKGLTVGVVVSFLLVTYVRTDIYKIFKDKGVVDYKDVPAWAPFSASEDETPIIDASNGEIVKAASGKSVSMTVTPKEEMETPSGEGGGIYFTVEESDVRLYVLDPKGAAEEKPEEGERNAAPEIGEAYEVKGEVFMTREKIPAMMIAKWKEFKEPKPADLNDGGEQVRKGEVGLSALIYYGWMWPITFFVTLGFGVMFPRKDREQS